MSALVCELWAHTLEIGARERSGSLLTRLSNVMVRRNVDGGILLRRTLCAGLEHPRVSELAGSECELWVALSGWMRLLTNKLSQHRVRILRVGVLALVWKTMSEALRAAVTLFFLMDCWIFLLLHYLATTGE